MINKRSDKILLKTLSLLAPFLVLISVWFPEFQHYYVPGGHVSDATVQQLRTHPDKNTLTEIAGMPLLDPSIKGLSVQEQADRIIAGELLLPGQPPVKISLPFAASDLDKNSPSWQLSFAGLSAVRVLLDAYEQTAQERYFSLAKAMLLAWAEYEANAWLPKGFIWNDHAVAARVSVLSQFWGLYRSSAAFDTEIARTVLGFVLRSAQLLAAPTHFTHATNHGVMQNLGLWHVAVAFPNLPGVQEFQTTAFERMQAQMEFYINDEGVVLEHSAGYHAHGVYFLGSALRYMSLLGQPIPPQWHTKYQKAKAFYANLVRPDGSIPIFGDTPREHDARNSLITDVLDGQALPLSRKEKLVPQQAFTFYPSAGYAVLWSGLENWQAAAKIAQTVMVWSYFPGHGHKLADDMSVLLWADNQDWWSNIGYWPYGRKGRQQAVSWHGSNAPHLIHEATETARYTRLRYYGNQNGLTIIDLERTDAGGFQPRRQMLHIAENMWLILDSTKDQKNRVAEHVWTTLPEIQVMQDSGSGGYWLIPPSGSSRLQTVLLGSTNVSVERLHGSTEPFAGWMVMKNREIQKSQAFLVRQPSDMSWSLAVWKLVNEKDNAVISLRPKMSQWNDAEHWRVSIPMSSGEVMVQRQGNTVSLIDHASAQVNNTLTLAAGPDVIDEFTELQNAFNAIAADNEGYRDLAYYRKRVTYLIIVILLLQEILLWRISRTPVTLFLRVTAVIAWLALGMWLKMVYFVS
ncbi:MAG: hypothetical protein GXP08_07300 [Gammaproteobacteria bacterium]|nr:hypothetical protein [Gammaproteobacteria bacterium]